MHEGFRTSDPQVRLRLLKAVSDPSRLAILDRLIDCGDRCHGCLEEDLAIPTNRMSFHLRVLREAGLVRTERDGRMVRYLLADGALAALHAVLPGRDCAPVDAEIRPIATIASLVDGELRTVT